jgi:CBS domain-containing protein
MFGYTLTGIGIFLLAAGNLGGVWFAFLGWFLVNAARSEATHLLIHDALAGVRVRDVMTPEPITAPADLSIAELLEEHVMRHHCSAFPLVDDAGSVVGLITLRQLKTVLPSRRAELHASDLAWPVDAVPSAGPNDPLLELVGRLAGTTAGDGRALVFEDGRLVGIVSPTDVSRALDLACLRSRALPSPHEGRPAADTPPAKGTAP